MDNKIRRAILVSVCERGSELDRCNRSLDELERLLETAGGECYARVVQIKDSQDARTVIGSGKVSELRSLCYSTGCELVVFDTSLTPMQIRNLEDELGEVDVIDRSMLILDIFALHASSAEGKLQVELAQLKYTAPRLVGKGAALSRQGGGIGSRGPGETKLEIDRRHLRERIATLEERLRQIENNRNTMRSARDDSGLAKLAVVGYTNAGKSTLLNYLTGAGVLAEDKLFATLDSTTRRLTLPAGETVLITDTVGFIRKLPHHLIEAFKSTLDEVRYADLLIIVSDITDPEVLEHIEVTEGLISELGAEDKPRIYVYNKADSDAASYAIPRENTVVISARSGAGVDKLLSLIEKLLSERKTRASLLIPYSEQRHLSALYDKASVLSVDYLDAGILVKCIIDKKDFGFYKRFVFSEED
ncbi:MAG: GTPase HflX [Clostridia bacterium]|nr:GTPase HflX [Clostridia bacterium]